MKLIIEYRNDTTSVVADVLSIDVRPDTDGAIVDYIVGSRLNAKIPIAVGNRDQVFADEIQIYPRRVIK